MKTILIILVLLLSALLFLTNFDNPWQEDLRSQLRALTVTNSLDSSQNSIEKEDIHLDPNPHESVPVPIEGGERVPLPESKSRDSASLDTFKIEGTSKNKVPKDEPKASPVSAYRRSGVEQKEKSEERLTAADVRGIMEILDYSRRKLLGLDPGSSYSQNPKDRPKKSELQKMNTEFESKGAIQNKLREVAEELGIDPKLALGMAEIESACNPKAVSHKGAVGVLQIMPATAKNHFGVSRDMLFDPEVNIRIGLSWMKRLLSEFDQDLDLSLSAYNAGSERVIEAGYKIPNISETREYVRKVRKYMEAGA